MKKKRYSTEQMISILKECEASGNISEVCRKHGIAATTCGKRATTFLGRCGPNWLKPFLI